MYLHIPFCKSKCLYCDFCSFPHAEVPVMEHYADALCRELIARSEDCKNVILDSVYLGGGTPTVLPISLLERILHTVFSYYHISEEAECTVECNPATTDAEMLSVLRERGMNRLSIGVQSVWEEELRALGRLHRFSDVESTVRDARSAGFSNLSVDVMFGIPHQSEQSFLATLDAVCQLQPTHLSVYGLIVEEGTPFAKKQQAGRLILPEEENTRNMYFSGHSFLEEQGYFHYEISNFAKPGYESRHNLKYWNCDEYLGFGVAAYSDFSGARFGNSRDLLAYNSGKKLLEEQETPSVWERKNEYIMLRMRLADGVSESDFATRFGGSLERDFGPAMRRYLKMGLLQKTECGYAFTTEGWYVSNAVLSDILDFTVK